MELKKIQISNFRSIKSEIIEFNHNCLILLGKNEAGKSNVLKAIAAIFGQYQVSSKDRRKRIKNEKISQHSYYVKAAFELSNKDIEIVESRFCQRYKGFENIQFLSGLKLSDYVRKRFRYIHLIVRISEDPSPTLTYPLYLGKDLEVVQKLYFADEINCNGEGEEFILLSKIFSIVKEFYFEKPYNCHYWQYSDNFLLPSKVDIDGFKTEPSNYKALENIFQLCGREDIENQFSIAFSEDGDYHNLLEQVSQEVTQTFQKIWVDFKGTSIQLLPDGNQINIKIVDKAKYNCEDRSDGFKKFISILLMLSTQSRAKKIFENDLILIDEPDQSLYPTSARFLRDELITIAKTSKIIYSTHSQYMIDTETLDRHIVVEKKDDVTTLKKENANSPFTTDELLKRAIGSSIFECLKNKNILFEGYLDMKLFELSLEFSKRENEFKEFGKIYSKGISGVDCIVSILHAANKKFIIVADSDSASVSKRGEFKKEHPEYQSNWLAYADVVDKISTMEDFFTKEFIASEISKYTGEFKYIESKDAIHNIDKAVNQDKDKKQEIKNGLISNLKKQDLKEDYFLFLDKLKDELLKLK